MYLSEYSGSEIGTKDCRIAGIKKKMGMVLAASANQLTAVVSQDCPLSMQNDPFRWSCCTQTFIL